MPVKTPAFNNFLLTTPDSLLWYSYGDSVYSYSYRTRQTARYDCGKARSPPVLHDAGTTVYLTNTVGIGTAQNGRISYIYRYAQADVNSHAPFAMLETEPGVLAIASCIGLFRFDTRSARLDTMLYIPAPAFAPCGNTRIISLSAPMGRDLPLEE